MIWHLSLEAYVGLGISVFIIKSGLEMMSDTINEILGKRADREMVSAIKKTICEDEAVFGAFDLILHNYGPENIVGSVHVEIPNTMTADEIALMERRIAKNVYRKHGVMMAGIGIYSVNTQNDEIKEMRSRITHMVNAHEGVLQTHGFSVDLEKKSIYLDVILDFELADRGRIFDEIRDEIQQAYPDYKLHIAMDLDV